MDSSDASDPKSPLPVDTSVDRLLDPKPSGSYPALDDPITDGVHGQAMCEACWLWTESGEPAGGGPIRRHTRVPRSGRSSVAADRHLGSHPITTDVGQELIGDWTRGCPINYSGGSGPQGGIHD